MGFSFILQAFVAALLLFASCCFSVTTCVALVTEGDMPVPANGGVGRFNGSSGVAIGPRHIITAHHTTMNQGNDPNRGIGLPFVLDDVVMYTTEYYSYPNTDVAVAVLRPQDTIPANKRHPILRRPLNSGEELLIGGWGMTRGDRVGSNGYNWSGSWGLRWGRNRVSFAFPLQTVTVFDAPDSPDALPYESSGAMNDSGAGIFVQSNGQLHLAGTIASVIRMNQSLYGDVTYASAYPPYLLNWIDGILSTRGQGSPNTCPADFDQSGQLNIDDLFQFLVAWFAGGGDFNRNGRTEIDDIYLYLNAFFRGC